MLKFTPYLYFARLLDLRFKGIGNAMAGALAPRLFGAEARSAARLRRTRRQTRMFEA